MQVSTLSQFVIYLSEEIPRNLEYFIGEIGYCGFRTRASTAIKLKVYIHFMCYLISSIENSGQALRVAAYGYRRNVKISRSLEKLFC